MILSKKQTQCSDYWEDKTTKEILFGGGAGGGKSIVGTSCLLKSAIKYDGTRWLMGRSKLKTLKETTLNSFLFVAKSYGIRNGMHFKINNQSNTIHFINGSEILMKDLFYYPSDPNFDELGSLEITGAFIDECNQINEKAWSIVKSRIRYKLDEYDLIPKMLGACNPAKNFVYNNFYKPSKEGTLPKEKKFIQSLVTDNPNISQHYIENLKSLDEKNKQRLLYGNWEYDSDESSLVEYDKILDLFTNDFVPVGQKYITADIARLGNDRTIIRVWSGLRSVNRFELTKSRVDEVASIIKQIATENNIPMSNVICDEDGVGGGVVDILRCHGFVNNSSPIAIRGEKQNYANLKSQCYFLLAKYINENKIFINEPLYDIRNSIIEELEQIKQKDIDKDGKLAIISKDEVRLVLHRSSDDSDNIMMRMWFELVLQNKRKGITAI